MPTMTLSQQTVDFGACGPGPQTPQSVSYQISSDQPITITMEIATTTNSGFVATQSLLYGLVDGKQIPPSDGATTSGAPGTTNVISYAPPAPNSKPASNPTETIRIDFSPPGTPIPTLWSAVVSFFWNNPAVPQPVLLTSLQVTGKTAQLEMAVTDTKPIVVSPGATAKVPLKLEYDSVDSAAINVGVGPSQFATYPDLKGMTISQATINMPPDYLETPAPGSKGPKPGGTAGNSPGRVQTLDPHRTKTFGLPVTASKTIKPGNNQVAYLQFSDSSLPVAIGGPRVCKVTFDIPPLPIHFTVGSSQPIVVIRGRSVSVPIAVSYDGIMTGVIFKQPSTDQNLTVTMPTGTIGVGGNMSEPGAIVFKIAVAADSTITDTESTTLEIPWTANDGLSHNTITISLTILPSIKVFNSGERSPGVGTSAPALTGSALWTVYADGNTTFAGSVHSDDTFTEDFYFGMVSNVKGTNGLIGVMHTDSVGPVILDNNTSWNESGFDQNIYDHWAELLSAAVTTDVSLQVAGWEAFLGTVGIAIGWILLVGGTMAHGSDGQGSINGPEPTGNPP
jgi:hypothetical protein